MLTLGIDLAAQPKKTGACLLEWTNHKARIRFLETGWDDARIRSAIKAYDKCAIDVPLGWPEAFVQALQCHAAAEPWKTHEFSMSRYTHRETDRYVRDKVKKAPLSVSTDRIGVPALRAAALLSGREVDRSGAGLIVEVYPAAALCRWGFDPFEHDGVKTKLSYKGSKGRATRELLGALLRTRTSPWLHASELQWEACRKNDDFLDALVCALVARAAALELTDPVPPDMRFLAAREGWIALPKEGSLSSLTA